MKYYLLCLGFECSVLFSWHMQSGHGKVYIDSFGLFISTPLVSLCALILSKCLFNDFHLHINGNCDFHDLECGFQCLGPQTKGKYHMGIEYHHTRYVGYQRVRQAFFCLV